MNIVALVGNITKKPEIRLTKNNNKYCRFTLAVRRNQQETDFIDCVAWKGTCDILERYVDKGHKVGVTGQLQKSSYQGQSGKVYVTEVIVQHLELTTKKETQQQTEFTPTFEPLQPSVEVTISEDDLPFY